MINTDVSSVTYNTVEGQAIYSIPFPFNEDLESGTPELSVTLDGVELQYNGTGENGYTITPDGLQLAGTVAANKVLVIKRKIRFVQDYLFQVGLIDAKQIEAAFDDSVMRDQQLAQEIKDLNFAINEEIEALKQKDQDILEEVSLKANKEDVYTKTETDNKLSQKANSADVYDKETVDSKLSSKAEASNTYTKADVDSKLAQKADSNSVYDKGTIDSKFDAKADKSDTYTKTEVDTLVEKTVSKEQGVDNAGKVLGVGEDGSVTLVEVATGDYVEKAGDEMTGPLGFVNSASAKTAIDIDDMGRFTLSFGDNAQPSYRANSDYIVPATDDEQWIGSHDHRWTYVYTKHISSEAGSTIVVPARNGEMLVASGGTEGQVLTKTTDGYEWSDAQGGGASNDPFPTEDDFIPIIYSTTSEEPESFYGSIQINLGALSDGEYEFYVKTKPDNNSNFMRHYFRVTIKDGQIDWESPGTYYTIAFDPTEVGSQLEFWAGIDLRGYPLLGGKINNDYIIEPKAGYSKIMPGSFDWGRITNGDEIGQVSKVRNIATEETVTPIITVKRYSGVDDPNLSVRQIGINPFYSQPPQIPTTKNVHPIYPLNTTKIISLGMSRALRPGSDVSGWQFMLYPTEILVSIYSLATSSELDFVFKSDRAGFSIQEKKATGVFVGTKYAVYTNSNFPPEYIELVLYKDSVFGFNSEEYYVSVTETGVSDVASFQSTVNFDSLPSEFSLLQEITPISETTLPTENGTYTLELTITDGVTITSWSVLDVYSKEETDQQIQNAIGTIETALAEV